MDWSKYNDILAWIESVNSETIDLDKNYYVAEPQSGKRRRYNTVDSTYLPQGVPDYMLLHSPLRLETDGSEINATSIADPTSTGGQKRRHVDMAEGDWDGSRSEFSQDPARISIPHRPLIQLRRTSPVKRDAVFSRSIKTRADLELLEKAVRIRPLSGSNLNSLPDDAGTLCHALRTTANQGSVVPDEVRQKISGLEIISPECFRAPGHINGAEAALATYMALNKIHLAAEASFLYQRHESAWNNLVHTPLLQLVFGSCDNEKADVSVRVEPVMSATMTGDSIPQLESFGTGQTTLACSVSATLVTQSDDGSVGANLSLGLSQLHSCANSKKVDYVVVMDMATGSSAAGALKKTIRNLVCAENIANSVTPGPHVNQTTYGPVAFQPIAVSIETKTASSLRDPLTQLGIWTAAWHRRMYALRRHLLLASCSSRGPLGGLVVGRGPGTSEEQQQLSASLRLVSVPLIVVMNHDWVAYFACDAGNSIDIYGPVAIGSTSSMLMTYTLLASLEAIKSWVETTFYAGMEAWFECKASSAE